MKTTKHLVFLTLLLSFSLYSYAGSKEVLKIIEKYHQEGKFNGSVLVAQGDQILCHTAVGLANTESQVKNSLSTQFYAASITKTFTAVAIAQLVEQGKLQYKDTIKTFLPHLGAFASKITIHQLLTHTSGIPDYEVEMPVQVENNNQQVIAWLNRENRLNFTPGSQHKYCNSGFILLAKIIEKVSGVTYETYLQQHIFTLATMQETTLYRSIKQKGAQIAVGYKQTGEKDDFEIMTYGDTGLLTTTTDLYRYAKSLNSPQVLPITQREVMYTPVELSNGKTANYGYGWRIVEQNGHKVVYHKGGLNGFKSILWRDLEDHTIIVLLTNHGDSLPTDALVKELYVAAQL